MFEATLSAKLKRIFDLKKVTFDRPSDSKEQEGVFIEITNSKHSIKDARQVARVQGKLHVFGNADKLPYGYFSKCIAAAELADVQDLFFYDFEENAGSFLNIVERSLSFIYLFDSQYDPNIGEITSIDLSIAEND